MTLEVQGFELFGGVFTPAEIVAINAHIDANPMLAAGSRRMMELPVVRRIAAHLGERLPGLGLQDLTAIQCICFEKDDLRNWLVPYHRDTAMPVAHPTRDARYAPWSEKEGVPTATIPTEMLATMLAVRLHLDECGPDHGPLRIIPGSHLRPETGKAAAERVCVVGAGGVVVMRPNCLHASSKSRSPNRRRVLHFVFAPPTAPPGLEWPKWTWGNHGQEATPERRTSGG